MDLSTTYLGLPLPHPIMPGAGPMADDLDTVRRLEDAGAAAIVMRSLFEEQLVGEQLAAHHSLQVSSHSFSEAQSFLPVADDFALGPDEYLEQLGRIKAAVKVPVIASLNGTTPGGWLEHAQLMAKAGADALELNVYQIATDPAESAAVQEDRIADMVRSVTGRVSIPVAVKLSPFFTALPNLAGHLVEAGARGLILFNRFYQPDVDVDELEVRPALRLSDSTELRLRLRWLAVLSDRVETSLAASGGVHTGLDALKAVMCGAHAVQMVSAVLGRGPEVIATVRRELSEWLEEHEYESLGQALGSMNLARCPDPKAYERANYIREIGSWSRLTG